MVLYDEPNHFQDFQVTSGMTVDTAGESGIAENRIALEQKVSLYTWNCAAACRHVLCCADTTHCDDFKHFSRREIKFLFVSHVLGGWQNIVGLLAACFYTLETLLWWYFPQINRNKCILYFQRQGEYVCETLQQWLSTSMSDVANNANAHNS